MGASFSVVLALALALPGAARAASTVEAVGPRFVGPLLAGSLSDPRSPITLNLLSHADRLAGLAAPGYRASARPSFEANVEHLMAASKGLPLDRASAALLAQALAYPMSGETLVRLHGPLRASVLPQLIAEQGVRWRKGPMPDALRRLAFAAADDPSLIRLFNHTRLSVPDLLLPGEGDRLGDGDRPLEVLGRGTIGVVYAHAYEEGVALKVTLKPRLMLSRQTLVETAAEEEDGLRALAAIGAAPRLLGRGTVAGRLREWPVSARERVYGETVEELVAARRFGPEEHALARALIRRMAEAGVAAQDLNLSNMMIGTTALDPRRRALQVDAGDKILLPTSANADQREAELLDSGVRVGERRDEFVGWVQVYGPPLRELFDRALRRSMTPPLKERVRAWLFGPKKP